MLSDQSAEEGDSAARSSWKLYCVPRVLQSRSLLVVGGVLPRAPLPQDSSSCDGHSSVCSCRLSLSLALFRSLALTLSLSLVLLTGTLGQHPRYTATRSGVAALASSPAVSARKRYSFLPACLPAACLLACLPTCLPTLAFSHSHPLLFCLSPTLTCLFASSRRLPSCLRSLSP